jgi:hypothetical protein
MISDLQFFMLSKLVVYRSRLVENLDAVQESQNIRHVIELTDDANCDQLQFSEFDVCVILQKNKLSTIEVHTTLFPVCLSINTCIYYFLSIWTYSHAFFTDASTSADVLFMSQINGLANYTSSYLLTW